jgi:hypothetical protein
VTSSSSIDPISPLPDEFMYELLSKRERRDTGIGQKKKEKKRKALYYMVHTYDKKTLDSLIRLLSISKLTLDRNASS